MESQLLTTSAPRSKDVVRSTAIALEAKLIQLRCRADPCGWPENMEAEDGISLGPFH